jgi:hypothetical protein
MSIRFTSAAAVLGLSLALGGCDVVDRVEPRQSVSPEQALNTVAGFEALLVSSYDHLQDQTYYGQEFMLVPGALADNITVPIATSNRYPNFVTNVRTDHLNRWSDFYESINEMNLVLSQIDALEVEAPDPQAVRDRIKGEALFLRALNYHDLVRTKAYEPGQEVNGFTEGVIVRTEPTAAVADADFRARSPVSEVYALIISDLEQAATLLEETDRGSKTFASSAAASALLARVQLYASNWAAAEAAAEDALAKTSASLVVDDGSGDNLLAAWLAPTYPGSIFEIQNTPAFDGGTTSVNGSLQSLTDPTIPGFFDAIPTTDLLAVISEDDARSQLFSPATVSGEDLSYILKYQGTTATNVDRVPLLRVAEMLLILAEARAEQGDIDGALEALNTLRDARGLEDYADDDDDGVTTDELVDEVYLQRRIELAFEGHRFFDLKRRGLDIPKPQTGFAVLPYEDFRVLAPIPFAEVDNNDLLTQNPGYAD